MLEEAPGNHYKCRFRFRFTWTHFYFVEMFIYTCELCMCMYSYIHMVFFDVSCAFYYGYIQASFTQAAPIKYHSLREFFSNAGTESPKWRRWVPGHLCMECLGSLPRYAYCHYCLPETTMATGNETFSIGQLPWEVTYPFPNHFWVDDFLFQRWDIFIVP